MAETLMDLSRAQHEAVGIHSCPECGSFLDAPRAHPESGDLARKCAACRDWYRVASAGSELAD
jgi:hypothetical protein